MENLYKIFSYFLSSVTSCYSTRRFAPLDHFFCIFHGEGVSSNQFLCTYYEQMKRGKAIVGAWPSTRKSKKFLSLYEGPFLLLFFAMWWSFFSLYRGFSQFVFLHVGPFCPYGGGGGSFFGVAHATKITADAQNGRGASDIFAYILHIF